MSESELTEDQKLVKLGLRSPNQTVSVGAELLEQLKNQIAEEFDTFQENFDDANLSSFDGFETWLTDNGFDADTAANIRNNFEEKYSSFSDFKSVVLNDLESWGDFENEFSSGSGLRSSRTTDDGLSASGVKVYEESGVGRSGQSIPAGGVEIYGKEIHFSETADISPSKEEESGDTGVLTWSNIDVSPTSARVGDIIDISADVTNNTSVAGDFQAELIIDGSVKETKTVESSGNDTQTVSFEYTAGEDGTGTFEIKIGDTSTESLQVIYGGL